MKSFFKFCFGKILFLLLLTNTRMQPAEIIVPAVVTGGVVTVGSVAVIGAFIIREVWDQYKSDKEKNKFLIRFPGERIPIQIDIARGGSEAEVVAEITQGAVRALSMKCNLSEAEQKELYKELYFQKERFINAEGNIQSIGRAEQKFNTIHDNIIEPMKTANRAVAQAALDYRIDGFKLKNKETYEDPGKNEARLKTFNSIIIGFVDCNSIDMARRIDARIHLSKISQCDPDIFGWNVKQAALNLQARYFDKDKLVDISEDPHLAETMKIFLQKSPYNWKKIEQYSVVFYWVKERNADGSGSFNRMFLRDSGQLSEKEKQESYKNDRPLTILGKGMFFSPPDRCKEIFNEPYNKALFEVAVLCEKKCFEEAEALAERFGNTNTMHAVIAHYKRLGVVENVGIGLNKALRKIKAERLRKEALAKKEAALKTEADSTQKEKQKSLAPTDAQNIEQPISTPAPPSPKQDGPEKGKKQNSEQVKKECPVPPSGENKFIEDKSQEGHIFDDRPGHLKNTPENKKLLYDLANDPGCYLGGPDDYGRHWYGKKLEDGSQVWAEVRNNKIRNGGINAPGNIKTYNPKTGLKVLNPPSQKIPGKSS